MKITSREQAEAHATHGKLLASLWDVEKLIDVKLTIEGTTYEFIREPEPVEMPTRRWLVENHARPKLIADADRNNLEEFAGAVMDQVLARRAEMLRAMCSDSVVKAVLDTGAFYTSAEKAATERAIEVIALVREHIEANRPELTQVCLDDGYEKYWKTHRHDREGQSNSEAWQAGAQFGAEYRSNTDALRVKHGTELGALDAEYKKRVAEFNAVTSACAAEVKELRAEKVRLETHSAYHVGEATRLDKENLELRAENERLKSSFTSTPRGPLKVPSDSDIEEMTRTVPGKMDDLDMGAQWAIEWIKKANGAE